MARIYSPFGNFRCVNPEKVTDFAEMPGTNKKGPSDTDFSGLAFAYLAEEPIGGAKNA